jgi:hypothetical protein
LLFVAFLGVSDVLRHFLQPEVKPDFSIRLKIIARRASWSHVPRQRVDVIASVEEKAGHIQDPVFAGVGFRKTYLRGVPDTRHGHRSAMDT